MIRTTIIEDIKKKIEVITSDNKRLRSEILKLTAERDGLKEQRREMQVKVDGLNKRIAMLETATAVGGTAGDTQVAKARINRLLREIDKCVLLLNKQ
ncbi:MAG: hypothetical protein R3Y15_07260 [Rikenellaceae bacterium]